MPVIPQVEYIPVKVPEDLIVLIDDVVGTHGFRSRQEFVKEAIRRLLTKFNNPSKEEEV